MANLGPGEPELFLATWAAGVDNFTARKPHVDWDPSIAQIRSWMASVGETV